MTNRTFIAVAALSGLAAFAPAPAMAQQYVSGSAGFNFQAESDNSGAFSSDFTTGDGVAVPAGTVLPAGTSLEWTSEFDSGQFLAGAYGWRLNDAVRVEGEISYRQSDVDTHTDVAAGGGAIGAADAAVLITGAAPLGVTVADLVADGQGELTSLGFAVNAYYDFPTSGAFGFYVGGGLGLENIEIDFSPSATSIIDDDQLVLFGQVMAGGAFAISETTSLYGGYRYRLSEDVETDVALVPAALDIENRAHILEFGLRYSF
ncbi:MAG: outer membrane beta-barrel protein [Pseudomonadota bacterium]